MTKVLRNPWARFGAMLAFALAMIAIEQGLLRWAAHRDVSTALLAAGGTLPLGDLALAAAAMLARLFARIVLPGLVLQTALLAAWDTQRSDVPRAQP